MEKITVLVVEDEIPIAEAYAKYLQGEYDVRLAHNGEAALEELDTDVDVVLLDRRMPTLSGEEVLEEICKRDLDCRVGMLTGVEPDFDIVDMQFDTYVLKPVDEETLQETVDVLVVRSKFDRQLQEYYSLVSKKVALSQRKEEAELKVSDEYTSLVERVERVREELDATFAQLDEKQAFRAALQDVSNA